jgi:hypothetical protein
MGVRERRKKLEKKGRRGKSESMSEMLQIKFCFFEEADINL